MHIAIQTNNYQTGKTQVYDNQMTIGQLQQQLNMPIQYESYDYLDFLNNIASALDNGYSSWYSQSYKPTEYLYRPTRGANAGKLSDVFKTNKMGEYVYKDGMRMPISKNAAEKIRLTNNVRNLGRALKVGGYAFVFVVSFIDIKSAYDEEGYFGENTQREAAGAAGGFAGGLAGAKLGTIAGAAVAPFLGPFAPVAPIAGCIIMGFVGTVFGNKGVKWLYNLFD